MTTWGMGGKVRTNYFLSRNMVSESNEKSYETMVIDIELFLLFCINDSYMFETRSFLSTQWKAVLYIQFIRRLILYVHNGWSEIHFISIFLAKFNKRFTYLTFRCYFLKILGWSSWLKKIQSSFFIKIILTIALNLKKITLSLNCLIYNTV